MLLAAASGLSSADITVLLLGLAVLLGAARLLGELARRLRQPAVLGEIFAGILLGPTLLGALQPDAYTFVFPDTGGARLALEGFMTVAVALLLLVAGLEVSLGTLLRQGRVSVLVSATGIVFPFVIGFAVAWFFPQHLGMSEGGQALTFALFVGIALSITALPVIAKTLMDLNMFKSDIGVTIISAAMVDDLVGWIGFAFVLAMMHSDDGGPAVGGSVGNTVVLTVVFLATMLTLGRLLFHRLLPLIQAHLSWPGGVLGFILVTALGCAAFTEYIGIHAIFGAFIAGVAIGDSTHLRERTRDTIHQFITHIFAPVFFAGIGLRTNFIANFNLEIVVLVLLVAIVSKVGGCYLGARWARTGKRESLAIGFGMAGRGAMEIILGTLALKANLINEQLFVALVIMALATSLLSGPMMQKILARKHPRRLGELLSERHYVADLRAGTVRDAIAELSQRAAAVTGMNAEEIDATVWRREQIMHTGVGSGVAVPHARLDQLSKSLVILGRSRQGIDFDAADGEPARLICLLLSPRNDPAAQIELLEVVARAFITPEVRSHALAAQSYTEVLGALKLANHEEPLTSPLTTRAP